MKLEIPLDEEIEEMFKDLEIHGVTEISTTMNTNSLVYIDLKLVAVRKEKNASKTIHINVPEYI